MGVSNEQKALIIVATVVALGAGVRLTRDRGTAQSLVGAEPANAEVRQRGRGGKSSHAAKASRTAKNTTVAPAAEPVTGDLDRAGYVGARLDLDGATLAQIESLPGIGPTLASRIVGDRAAHGPFLSKEGLRRVRGIGPSLLRRLDTLVTFSGRLTPLPDSAAASVKLDGLTSKPAKSKSRSRTPKKGPKIPPFS